MFLLNRLPARLRSATRTTVPVGIPDRSPKGSRRSHPNSLSFRRIWKMDRCIGHSRIGNQFRRSHPHRSLSGISIEVFALDKFFGKSIQKGTFAEYAGPIMEIYAPSSCTLNWLMLCLHMYPSQTPSHFSFWAKTGAHFGAKIQLNSHPGLSSLLSRQSVSPLHFELLMMQPSPLAHWNSASLQPSPRETMLMSKTSAVKSFPWIPIVLLEQGMILQVKSNQQD